MKRNHILRALALFVAAIQLNLAASAIEERDVNYYEDFTATQYTEGTQIDDKKIPLRQFWSIQQFANYQVAPCSVIVQDNGKSVLHFQGYSGMLSASEMFDSYTYSVTMKMPKGVNGGIAVAARHASGSSIGPLYEADMFVEHGGNPSWDREGFRHDYSGIAVYPTAQTDHAGNYLVVIGIKTFEDNKKHRVANRYYEVYTTTDLTKYFTLAFVDRNNELTISLNGSVLCSVEMSNPGTYRDPNDKNEYYKNAVLKDSAGDTVLELDNAKLAVQARLAITNRNSHCYIQSIEAFSDNPANGTIPPETTPPETLPQTGEETETEATVTEENETTNALTISTDLLLLIGFGTVQVILVGCIGVIVLKKKKH